MLIKLKLASRLRSLISRCASRSSQLSKLWQISKIIKLAWAPERRNIHQPATGWTIGWRILSFKTLLPEKGPWTSTFGSTHKEPCSLSYLIVIAICFFKLDSRVESCGSAFKKGCFRLWLRQIRFRQRRWRLLEIFLDDLFEIPYMGELIEQRIVFWADEIVTRGEIGRHIWKFSTDTQLAPIRRLACPKRLLVV